jgi:hypothetical protein
VQVAQFASAASQRAPSLLASLHPSVRARLQGVQRVTCALPGVLFEECDPYQLSEKATIIPAAEKALKVKMQHLLWHT